MSNREEIVSHMIETLAIRAMVTRVVFGPEMLEIMDPMLRGYMHAIFDLEEYLREKEEKADADV